VRYGDRLPVHRGAWPDWWDDGIASSAFETGLVRFAHEDLLTAEKAAALAVAHGAADPFPSGELHLLAENLLHYAEHTWGWWRSVEDPYSVESRVLGQRKSLYAGEAAMEGRRYRERAVRALAGRVMRWAPQACYCSPMQRCRQTAAAMVPDLPLRLDPDLREIDFGQWETRTFAEAVAHDPSLVDRWAAFAADFAFPGGEAVGEFLRRVRAAAPYRPGSHSRSHNRR